MSVDGGATAINRDVAGTYTGTHPMTKVVVVGAGIGGLTAAVKLICNGIKDVVVLEAQDYIGGRIKAQAVGDTTMDMGAMFIHGQIGNPIYEIVERLGMEAKNVDEMPSFFYTSERKKIPPKEVEILLDVFEDEKRAGAAEVGQNRLDVIAYLYNQFLLKNEINIDHPKRELYDAVYRFFLFYECTEDSCSNLNEVSAWSDSKYVCYSGNQHTLIKGGYSVVIDSLVDLIPKGVIRTETPVACIDWTNPQDGGILVRCVNGDVFCADHVIVTMSIGCLKSAKNSMFSPALPTPFLNSVGKVELGYIGKIFVKWDTPFWNRQEGALYNFLWLESEHPAMLKQDKSKRKTCFGKPWWYGINGCHSVTDGDNCLLFWFLRHQMDAIRGLDDQEVMSVLHELMQAFMDDVDIPVPSTMYKTDWEHNPYIQGTYTYCLPSFDSNDVEEFNRPVFPSALNPRLLFAGEAFSIEYITTTHSAFITGEDQAERILKANGITESMRVVDAISYK